jgi:hypothetical protein
MKDYESYRKVATQSVATSASPTRPLFGSGNVYATPAILDYLAAHGRKPAELLGFHQGGEWGDVSAADRKANNLAVKDGSRILSCHLVEGRKVFVITEATGDDELRASTCLLFAEEYCHARQCVRSTPRV